MFAKIAHKSEELAKAYLEKPLLYHNIENGIVITVVIFLNSYGLWQTNATIHYN